MSGYGLYPGKNGDRELEIEFLPGLTLIVGANGLGKTTLITLVFRMLVGAYDIPQLGVGDELGFRRLAATPLPPYLRDIFAARVGDRAEGAVARLEFALGSVPVVVERNIRDLSMRSAIVGGHECTSEEEYQSQLSACAGVGSFGDFILLLRYLVFYFEDRRQLVWDASAQRQLLRMLFLPPDIAQRWTEMERSILQNDSRMRNFQAVVGKEEKTLTKALSKVSSAVSLRAELQALEVLQEPARERQEDLESQTEGLDSRRQDARLANLKAQQERESRFRALEHAKLVAIESRFPGRLETGRYMVAHLMSEHDCLVCGSHAPAAAEAYSERLSHGRCVVCDSDLTKSDQVVEARDVADERVVRSQTLLESAERELSATARDRVLAESAFDGHVAELARLRSEIAARSLRVSQIVNLLPPDEAALQKQRAELSSIRGRLESMKADLAVERREFRGFIEQCTSDLLASSSEIVQTFEEFAGKFLSESVSLTWNTRPAAVGQGGEAIPFPAFELNMTGSDFSETVRRAGPNDVSESQREFVDLSFRMALMRSAGDAAATLIIDTPESSLDAVFAKRAGKVLINFGEGNENRVIVTSNLIEGSLLPTLVAGIAETPEKGERLVDLFDLAKPTAAVIADREAYSELRQRLLYERLQ